MSIATSGRRLKVAIVIGAALGLSALAIPTAATAAETCIPSTTATAATQPWLTFSQSPNKFNDIEAIYADFVPGLITSLGTVTTDFTQAQLDALRTSINTNFTDTGVAVQAIGNEIELQRTTLENALLAIDPASGPATQAVFDGFDSEISASAYGVTLNAKFITALTAVDTYLTDVQTAITGGVPAPLLATVTTDPIDALGVGIVGYGAFAGGVVYGGAADLVVYACAASLAATGANDPTPLVGGASLLLALGASVLIAAKRRETHAA